MACSPVCQEQLPLHDGALRCSLPAAHHSEEHYDAGRRELWISPHATLRPPRADSRPSDAPWTDEPAAAWQEPA